MSVVVREVRPEEVEVARQLTNRSWLTTYAPLIGAAATEAIIIERHAKPVFEAQANDARHVFLVAECDGEITGHCHAFQRDGCYIDRLHVEPGRKRAGIGRELLSHVENGLPGGARVWLEVLQGNEDAIAFYRRMGFAPAGASDACGGLAGIPALYFEKTLASAQRTG